MRNKHPVTIVAIIITLALVSGIFFGPEAHAQRSLGDLGLDITLSVAFCKALPGLADLASDLIDKAFDFVVGAIKSFASKIPVIGGLFGGSGGIDRVEVVKDDPASRTEFKNCVANAVKRQFVRAAAEDILTFVRGDSGVPQFIEDFRDVVVDAADRAGAQIVSDVIGKDICRPFKGSVEILVHRAAFPRQVFDSQISCTLSDAIDIQGGQLQRYFDDFRDGGWPAWISLHESQNTLLGAYLIAEGERQRILEVETKAAEIETNTSQGFKPTTICTEATFHYGAGVYITKSIPDTEVGSPDWNALIAAEGALDADCTDSRTITPASTVGNQATNAISAEFSNLIGADEWYEIVLEVITILTSNFLDDGLATPTFDTSSAAGPAGILPLGAQCDPNGITADQICSAGLECRIGTGGVFTCQTPQPGTAQLDNVCSFAVGAPSNLVCAPNQGLVCDPNSAPFGFDPDYFGLCKLGAGESCTTDSQCVDGLKCVFSICQ